jgi:RNA polymerase sigma factor (sigma-70 family)
MRRAESLTVGGDYISSADKEQPSLDGRDPRRILRGLLTAPCSPGRRYGRVAGRGGSCMSRVSRQWFDEFVTGSRDELTGYLNHMLRSKDDALEVSQEAYFKVFLALRKHPDRDHCPKALLYTTARNLAISRLRHQRIVSTAAPALLVDQQLKTELKSPEQHASTSEDLRSLLWVINQLPPKCRKVLLLRMIDGLSQKEIAKRLDIAVSTVEKHLAKGLHCSTDAMRRLKTSGNREDGSKRIAKRGAS